MTGENETTTTKAILMKLIQKIITKIYILPLFTLVRDTDVS